MKEKPTPNKTTVKGIKKKNIVSVRVRGYYWIIIEAT
jgi:hypothetical protein